MRFTTANMTTGEVSKLLGIPRATIACWVDKGIVKPSHRGYGTGHDHLYSIRDILAISVGRDLRRRGCPTEHAAAAIHWLHSREIGELVRCWRSGRKLMLVVGNSVLPALATRDEIFNNPHLDLVAASTTGIPVSIVDVQAAYVVLDERIRKHRAGEPCEAGESSQLGSVPVQDRRSPGERISA